MAAGFKNTCFNIWKPNTDRRGIRTEFRPVFQRFIGVENAGEYNNILKTYADRFENHKSLAVYFDGEIPMEPVFELINAVKSELPGMDITRLSTQDITIFEDAGFNSLFLGALEYSVNLALSVESFANDSQKHNFIMKMILWAFQHLANIKPDINQTPKCLYYGNISRHEIYFLIMLSKMGFDVIYINPLKEEYWNEIDRDQLSAKTSYSQILQVESLHAKISGAQVIEQNESVTLQFERQMEEELFTGTGVFRPWQFRDGTTKSMFISSTLIDISHNWNEPARVRAGFSVNGKTVTVPYFFHIIDGEYRDKNEYAELFHTVTKSGNTLVLINGTTLPDGSSLKIDLPSEESQFQIQFCYLSDGSLDPEKVKELEFYRYGRYKPEVQDFILKKINETITDESLFARKLSKSGKIRMIALLLSMDERIIRLIDSFDYVEQVPKIVIFVENDNQVPDQVIEILGFMSKIGTDIVILNPSGIFSPDSVINRDRYNANRLEEMNYTRTYSSVGFKKKGFFGKIFG